MSDLPSIPGIPTPDPDEAASRGPARATYPRADIWRHVTGSQPVYGSKLGNKCAFSSARLLALQADPEMHDDNVAVLLDKLNLAVRALVAAGVRPGGPAGLEFFVNFAQGYALATTPAADDPAADIVARTNKLRYVFHMSSPISGLLELEYIAGTWRATWNSTLALSLPDSDAKPPRRPWSIGRLFRLCAKLITVPFSRLFSRSRG